MLLESRGYVGTRDDLVINYPTRTTVEVDWPDQKNVREYWPAGEPYRMVNTAAPEGGGVKYHYAMLDSTYLAEMMDILNCQSAPSVEDAAVIRAIRGTPGALTNEARAFQYGVMVGKHIERKRRQLEEQAHEDTD